MKHMKTVEVPATKKDEVDFVTCDLCGRKIGERGFDVDEVEVFHREGKSYPGFASGIETSVDMCGECFDDKLVPWLRSQGVEPRTDDFD